MKILNIRGHLSCSHCHASLGHKEDTWPKSIQQCPFCGETTEGKEAMRRTVHRILPNGKEIVVFEGCARPSVGWQRYFGEPWEQFDPAILKLRPEEDPLALTHWAEEVEAKSTIIVKPSSRYSDRECTTD